MESKSQSRRWSDGRRVNVMDPVDVGYWTKFFGVEEIDLYKGVDKVGTSVEHLKDYFHVEQALLWVVTGAHPERRRGTS